MHKVIFFFIICLSFSISKSHACSCAEWESANELMNNTDSLVLGVPVDNGVLHSENGPFGQKLYRYGIKIVKHFKGRFKKFMYIVAPKGNGVNCGVYFKQYDGLYLISGFRDANSAYYHTSGCDVGYVSYEDESLNKIIKDLLSK